jgi:YgiT-type zinc finger domain-containing protein
MKCEFCGAEVTKKRVRKPHWYEGRLHIVEDVEAKVCRVCGKRCFHATTLDRIDALVSGDHPVKEVLSVEVVSA